MAMSAAELKRRDYLLDRLKKVWESLTTEERSALETVVGSMAQNHTEDSFYQPLTEAQMAERIDRSLEHLSQGLGQPSKEMEAELIAEFDL